MIPASPSSGSRAGTRWTSCAPTPRAYVMPSRQEGLPLSLLEMLWYGMPVIASDIPAVHEVDGAVVGRAGDAGAPR